MDDGAASALIERGKSLLPIGVLKIEGDFVEGELVEICTHHHQVIARGLVAVDSSAANEMKGKKLIQIETDFGWSSVLVHRDDMVILES